MTSEDPCYNAVVCAQGTSGYFFGWMGCATAIVFAKYVIALLRMPCGVLMPPPHMTWHAFVCWFAYSLRRAVS